MANIITSTASASGFIPNVWAARALDVLRAKIVLAKLIARDSDFEPGWVGQTLTIGYPGTFAAQQKTEGNLATVQTPVGGSTVTLTLDHHEYVDFIVEDFARTQANIDLMDRYIQPAMIALAEKLENDLVVAALAGWTTNSAVGTAGVDISSAQIRAARRVFNTQKIPESDRVLVVSPKDEVAMLGDTSLATYFAFSQTQAIREGSMGRMYGFDVYMSQFMGSDGLNEKWTVVISGTPTSGNYTLTLGGHTTANIAYNGVAADVQAALEALPNIGTGNVKVTDTGTTPNFTHTIEFIGDLVGEAVGTLTATDGTSGGSHGIAVTKTQSATTTNLAFHPNALMVGFRPFREIEPGSGVESAIMVDDVSGLAIRVIHQYNVGHRGHYVGYDLLYGFSTLRANHGLQVLS